MFFAGEATSHDQWQSVHGAFLSGKRAAKEVCESLKGQQQLHNSNF